MNISVCVRANAFESVFARCGGQVCYHNMLSRWWHTKNRGSVSKPRERRIRSCIRYTRTHTHSHMYIWLVVLSSRDRARLSESVSPIASRRECSSGNEVHGYDAVVRMRSTQHSSICDMCLKCDHSHSYLNTDTHTHFG